MLCLDAMTDMMDYSVIGILLCLVNMMLQSLESV